MIIPYHLVPIITVFLAITTGCGHHKKNKKLAPIYLRLAEAELADHAQTPIAYKQALAHINQALVYDQNGLLFAFKASILFKLNQLIESRSCFEQALKIVTDQHLRADILNNYACLLAEQGDTKKAFELWHSLTTNPYYLSPEVAFLNSGKLLYQTGHRGQAINHFATALQLNPEYTDAHYYLACAQLQEGNRVDAAKQAQTVLATNQTHYGAQEILKTLNIIDK